MNVRVLTVLVVFSVFAFWALSLDIGGDRPPSSGRSVEMSMPSEEVLEGAHTELQAQTTTVSARSSLKFAASASSNRSFEISARLTVHGGEGGAMLRARLLASSDGFFDAHGALSATELDTFTVSPGTLKHTLEQPRESQLALVIEGEGYERAFAVRSVGPSDLNADFGEIVMRAFGTVVLKMNYPHSDVDPQGSVTLEPLFGKPLYRARPYSGETELTFDSVVPGTWRVRVDLYRYAASPTLVDVLPGRIAYGTIDLRSILGVSGQIVLEDPTGLASVDRLFVTSEEEMYSKGARSDVTGEGAFFVPAPEGAVDGADATLIVGGLYESELAMHSTKWGQADELISIAAGVALSVEVLAAGTGEVVEGCDFALIPAGRSQYPAKGWEWDGREYHAQVAGLGEGARLVVVPPAGYQAPESIMLSGDSTPHTFYLSESTQHRIRVVDTSEVGVAGCELVLGSIIDASGVGPRTSWAARGASNVFVFPDSPRAWSHAVTDENGSAWLSLDAPPGEQMVLGITPSGDEGQRVLLVNDIDSLNEIVLRPRVDLRLRTEMGPDQRVAYLVRARVSSDEAAIHESKLTPTSGGELLGSTIAAPEYVLVLRFGALAWESEPVAVSRGDDGVSGVVDCPGLVAASQIQVDGLPDGAIDLVPKSTGFKGALTLVVDDGYLLVPPLFEGNYALLWEGEVKGELEASDAMAWSPKD